MLSAIWKIVKFLLVLFIAFVLIGQAGFYLLSPVKSDEEVVTDLNCKMIHDWLEDKMMKVPVSERRGWAPKEGECGV